MNFFKIGSKIPVWILIIVVIILLAIDYIIKN
jgi:hypothetical protein